MERSEYRTLYENENVHFYSVANHRIILTAVEKYFGKVANLNILDAGCGTGGLTEKLKRFGSVVGVDTSEEAVAFSLKRGVDARRASVENLPFNENTFDLVVSMDVIYHQKVGNDVKALKEFARVLRPGGILILKVPSYDWLRRSCDRQVHTKIRYTRRSLKNKLIDAGFSVNDIRYVNALLTLPAILTYFLEKISGAKDAHTPVTRLPKFVNRVALATLSTEQYISSKLHPPFGLGILAICSLQRRTS
ncbi:MAG TPA: class I SAM-dependent methyltransferase [Candidatus Paceibacterota bacterium]